MNASITARALLPAGLHDLLPPEAEREAALAERAMASFRSHGYQRVKPPLVEFEESLLSGVGRAWSRQTFRVLDPESQRMMGVRADMTLQVARIASSRLIQAPRPLRLCYAGEVLRVGGDQLTPERQFRQIGCELIGSLDAQADTEIVLLAARTLAELGVDGVSVDLNAPTLVPAIFKAHGIDSAAERRLSAALVHRDAAVTAAEPGIGALLTALLDVAGPAGPAIEKLAKLELPGEADSARIRLIETVRRLRIAAPDLTLTVDPVERQGFEYQTGLSFTIFARGARRELGRGGRYRIGADIGQGGGEPATGFSLFADAVFGVAPAEAPVRRVYIPQNIPAAEADRLRKAGWITVAGLTPADDEMAEARRLGCDHAMLPGSTAPQPLT